MMIIPLMKMIVMVMILMMIILTMAMLMIIISRVVDGDSDDVYGGEDSDD